MTIQFWAYLKAAIVLAPTALGSIGLTFLGKSPVIGFLYVVSIWIQLATFMQMENSIKIQYSDLDDSMYDLMVNDQATVTLVRRIQSSENQAEQNELLEEFGRACFERGAKRERLRWVSKRRPV